MGIVNINLNFIKTVLENKTGFEFESVVSFILGICDQEYNSTRESKDGGIDGIKYFSKTEVIPYTIYGPKKLNWNNVARKKIDDDVSKINLFLDKHPEVKLKKWRFIINTELSVEQIHYIISKFNNNKIVEIITPQKLMNMISMEDKYAIAVGNYLNLTSYNLPLNILNEWTILEESIKKIGALKNLNTKEKKEEQLNEIIEAIIEIAYRRFETNIELYNFVKESKNSNNIERIIFKGTWIPSSYKRHFVFFNGEFSEMPLSDLSSKFHIDPKRFSYSFYVHENNYIIFTPNSLLDVYSMCMYFKNKMIDFKNAEDINETLMIEEYLKRKAKREIFIYKNTDIRKWNSITKKIE